MMQLNVVFPTNAVYSLKKFYFSNVELELLFFSSTAWIQRRGPLGRASYQDDQQQFF